MNDETKPQLGLKPLNLSEWIEVDSQWESHLSLKRELLRDHRETVFKVFPEAEAGCLELHKTLGQHLTEYFPEQYKFTDGKMDVLSPALARSYQQPTHGTEALEQVAEWTQEDWALLSPEAPVKLLAGCVCFPSRWSLAEKIGKDSDGIHQPVPRFSGIARPTQSFLERMTVDKPMWRLNWTIHDSEKLFCPGPLPGPGDLSVEDVLERTWLRVERQTLRRLPETKWVVFSIRTYIHPLSQVLAEPARRQRLKETLLLLPEDTATYRGMKAFLHLLLKAL